MAKKLEKVKTLRAKCDRIFSEYIRRKSADDSGNVSCITCGKTEYWREQDAGHFISRANLSTRYNEFNCHNQCKYCNRFREGCKPEYAISMIEQHGIDFVNDLIQLSNDEIPDTKVFIKNKIIEFKEKLEAL